MKKLISVTVILLFIGLAFAPSINANEGKVSFKCGLIHCIDIFGGIGIRVIIGNPYPFDAYNFSWNITLNGIGTAWHYGNFSGRIDQIKPEQNHPIFKLVFGVFYGEIRVDVNALNGDKFFGDTIILIIGPIVFVRAN